MPIALSTGRNYLKEMISYASDYENFTLNNHEEKVIYDIPCPSQSVPSTEKVPSPSDAKDKKDMEWETSDFNFSTRYLKQMKYKPIPT